MHTLDILKYGHLWVLHHLDGIPEAEFTTPNVCGWWSVKEIMAHLASFEQVLNEVLAPHAHPSAPAPTPNLEEMISLSPDEFNDRQVARRQPLTWAQTLAEYDRLHTENMRCLPKLPPGLLSETGALPWYGKEYDLEDFVVYTFYGHKREHMAQVAIFRERLQL